MRSIHLRKTCPKCDTVVHVKRAVCDCGHTFRVKRKVRYTVDSEPEKVKRRKAVECEKEVTDAEERE